MKKLLLQEITPFVPLDDEKYDNYINRIKQGRENKKYKTVYMERHHIKPKSKGGTNDKKNLIYLLAQEHFYAHQLLAKENPFDQSLTWAFWNMSHIKGKKSQNRYVPTPEEYEYSRKLFVQSISGEKSPLYGKRLSEETKQKIREAKIKNPHVYTDEERKKCKQRTAAYEHSFAKKQPDRDIMRKKVWDNNCLAVVCVNTGIVYNSAAEVEALLKIDHSDIAMVCRGKQTSAGKDKNGNPLLWRYADKNLAEQFKPKKNQLKKSVLCITTGEIFESSKEACKKYNISPSSICSQLKGRSNKCCDRDHKNRFVFEYYIEGDDNFGSSTTL